MESIENLVGSCSVSLVIDFLTCGLHVVHLPKKSLLLITCIQHQT